MPKFTQAQIEAGLQTLIEFHGVGALKRVYDQGLSINPTHFDAIAELLRCDFSIEVGKGVSAQTSFRPALATAEAEIDADAIFASYNRDALRHAQGKDRIPSAPEGGDNETQN